jgi:hypothetical protein
MGKTISQRCVMCTWPQPKVNLVPVNPGPFVISSCFNFEQLTINFDRVFIFAPEIFFLLYFFIFFIFLFFRIPCKSSKKYRRCSLHPKIIPSLLGIASDKYTIGIFVPCFFPRKQICHFLGFLWYGFDTSCGDKFVVLWLLCPK